MFICAYFPFSRSFVPIFRFLGLELGCLELGLCLFSIFSFGIRLCSFVPIFHFLGLELGCVFSVWN